LCAATECIDRGIAFPDDGSRCRGRARRVRPVGSTSVRTHRHRLLDRLPEAEVDDELDRSIALIGEHVGRAPRDFAYPKALLGSPAAERSVRARFRSAAVAGTRPNPIGATDPYRLARSPVQASDGQRWFVRKAAAAWVSRTSCAAA
jgi:peptidoglycan/xylan/chitin deacetylase (PgdA/CDA1 family)